MNIVKLTKVEQKSQCAKVKEIDIAGLQTQAFRYLALEPPMVQPTPNEKDGNSYRASFIPKSRVPEDLENIIRASKEVKCITSREHLLFNSRSLKT